jgi:hypothetical protein
MALGVRTYPIMSVHGQRLLDRNKPRDFVEVIKKADLKEDVRREIKTIAIPYLIEVANGVSPAGSGSLVAR